MKPKLLLLVPLPPPMHGSNIMNERVVNNQALYDIFDIRVLPLRYSTTIAEIGHFNIGKVMALITLTMRLIQMLRTFRPKYVYFVIAPTGIAFYRDALHILLLKIFNAHIIFHLRGKGIREKTTHLFARKIYQWAFQNESIIMLSPYLFFDIQNVAKKDQVHFLPNGIPVPSRTTRKENAGPPVILFLSNLIETKGPLILLKALKRLNDQKYDFRAIYVGAPATSIPETRFNTLLNEYGLEKKVTWIGPKYGDEKAAVLAEADIFSLPTYNDCFPSVLLEAMANGLPIVATDEGAIPEIIDEGNSGYIVPRKDDVLLAEKLAILLDNENMRLDMGLAGQKKFFNTYTLPHFNRNLIKTLQTICG